MFTWRYKKTILHVSLLLPRTLGGLGGVSWGDASIRDICDILVMLMVLFHEKNLLPRNRVIVTT